VERARSPGVGAVSIRLGYQIPNFSYGAPVADLFPSVVRQALVINRVTNGHRPGAVDLAGRTLRELLG
jgi:hypothetical protein